MQHMSEADWFFAFGNDMQHKCNDILKKYNNKDTIIITVFLWAKVMQLEAVSYTTMALAKPGE